jgi:cyanophycinase
MEMSQGVLMIIGGGEDKKQEMAILREFVRLSGGDQARILVMTAATRLPQEVGSEYERVFREIAGENVYVKTIHISVRSEAFDPAVIDEINLATGVFFTGGSQFRISSVIGGTKVDIALHNRYDDGLVIAGTSAGASMMSSLMIIEGAAAETATVGQTKLGAGLDFLPGVIVDQHFSQRGRTNRLLSAIARHPHYLGIGIDENTSIIVRDKQFSVLGEGSITVLDVGEVTSGLPDKDDDHGQNLAVTGVLMHLLTQGSSFDLRNRSVSVQQQ